MRILPFKICRRHLIQHLSSFLVSSQTCPLHSLILKPHYMAIFVWSGQHDQWQMLELLRFIGRSSSSNFDHANLHLRSYAQICRCCIWWSSFWDTHQLTIYPDLGETSILAHFFSWMMDRRDARNGLSLDTKRLRHMRTSTFWHFGQGFCDLEQQNSSKTMNSPTSPIFPSVSQLRQEQQVQEKEEKQRTAERSPPLPQSDHSIAFLHLHLAFVSPGGAPNEPMLCVVSWSVSWRQSLGKSWDFEVILSRIWFMNFDWGV